MSTYNVLEACRKLRITNVVLASSETLIGLPFPNPPLSLPITEETPRQPESAYSLSKLLGEVMGEQYCRWDQELKVISLRFSNVMTLRDYDDFEGWQDDAAKRVFNVWGYIDAYVFFRPSHAPSLTPSFAAAMADKLFTWPSNPRSRDITPSSSPTTCVPSLPLFDPTDLGRRTPS